METTSLSELAIIQTGPFGSQLHQKDYVSVGTPLVTVEHLGERKISNKNLSKVSDEDVKRLSKYIMREGDIIFSRVGYVDRCSYVSKPNDGWLFSGSCLRVRADSSKINPSFLFYWLRCRKTIQFVKNISVGATRPSLNTGLLGEIPVWTPSLPTQRKIASVLSAIDDRIELNERMRENLMNQLMEVFVSRFIGNKEGKIFKKRTLSSIIVNTLGGDWGKEAPQGNNTEKVYCIRGADFPSVRIGEKGKMPFRYILPKNYKNKALKDGDIVVEISGGSPTQSTGRVVVISQSLLDRYDHGLVCTNFCRAVTPKKGYGMFLYHLWQYLYDTGLFFNFENGTTGIKNFDLNGFITRHEVEIPDEASILEFNDFCIPFFNKISHMGLENERLAALRDTLLPKLMSGEIDVDSVEI